MVGTALLSGGLLTRVAVPARPVENLEIHLAPGSPALGPETAPARLSFAATVASP